MATGIKKLAEQTAVYGISSIVARLLNYLLVPYLTRIMTPAEYGVITDMYAIIPFAMVILTLGLETGYFRFAAKARTRRRREEVFSTTWGATSYMGLAFMAVAWMWQMPIATAMGYGDRPELFMIMAGIITLDMINAIPFVRLREQGRAARFVWVRIVSVAINLGLCFFFYGALPHIPALARMYDPSFGAGYYMVANLISSLATLVIVTPVDTKRLFRGMNWRLLRQIMVYSLPLLLSGIAGTANEFIDRQMIKFLVPEHLAMASLGIYGAVMKIGVVMLLFTQMYRLAAEPFFLAEFKKEDFMRVNAEAMKYFIIVSITLFLGITLFADLFALIIGAEFRHGMYILPWVLAGNILSGVVLNLSFWYKQSGRTLFAVVVTGTGLIFTIGMGYWLIPKLGFMGASLARVACEGAMVLVSYWFKRRYFPIPYDLKRIGEYVLVGLALYATGFFTALLPDAAEYLLNLCLVAAFFFYALWREKIDLAGMLRSVIKTVTRK
ncbi:MAG: oligosaccharide flippase family protein [Rikenellaceae bacterium]|jgi:O-antigen/teichoic acid export membrane protein|nr:oligosaccharide flippase family protein [Rikenellaceae bacterium]